MSERRKKEKVWNYTPLEKAEENFCAELASELGISPVLAQLLLRRGYCDADSALRFFNCTDAVLHRPFLMKDMQAAAERVCRAVDAGERILVFGDYDADGITATGLLYLYLTDLGADVSYYIPSRTGEGYGLSLAAVDKFARDGITLIVTVDTGITANDEARYAATLGVDMVITDHHECRLPLPSAVAVVDPHRPDCPYPFKELAGVGVAFKLATACEINRSLERGEREIDAVRRMCARYADLMAIGTVADVMPILDENRVMVKYGIEQLKNTKRAGLAALIEEATAGGKADASRRKRITASFIGFTLAPRLNAAGRMSDATLAVELLLSEDEKKARELAAHLCEINQQRKQEEDRIAEEVFARIDEEFDLSDTHVLVLEADHWRQGVIGIVASRVTERYGRPTILVTFEGSCVDSPMDVGKGSGRSVKGLNLVEALSDSAELLEKYGGHELAAGLAVRRDRIDAFRKRINEYAGERASGEGGVTLDIDAELTLSESTMSLAEQILTLEPFGVGNPLPRFLVQGVTVERIADLGGGKHLKLTVTDGKRSLYALLFSTSRSEIDFCQGDRIDLVGTLEINEYRDVRSVQLTVQDARLAADHKAELELGRRRYEELRAGAPFDFEEGILPDRELFAHVFTVLRRELMRGRAEYGEGELLWLINMGAPRNISYPCMRYIVDVFRELQILNVEDLPLSRTRFEICYRSEKTSIEKSGILKKLRAQCRDRA